MFIRAQFKQAARKKLKDNAFGGILAGILMLTILAPLGRAVYNSGFNLWLLLALGLIMGPLRLAAANFYLTLYREDKGDIRLFFAGFNQCWRGALAMLWQFLWVFLWSLLLIVPGIVKWYGYSMQFFSVKR